MAQIRPTARDAVGRCRSVEGIGAPLPDVAGRVVQAVGVGREGVDRAGAVEAVGAGVLDRERALPDVHAVLAAGLELRAPRERLLLQATAHNILPLRLARQARARP